MGLAEDGKGHDKADFKQTPTGSGAGEQILTHGAGTAGTLGGEATDSQQDRCGPGRCLDTAMPDLSAVNSFCLEADL